MAYYKDLPIWRDAMRLAVEMELAVRGFPRGQQHAPSDDQRLDRFFETTDIELAVSAVVIPHSGVLAFVRAVSPRWSRDDTEIAVRPLPQSDGRRSSNHLIDATLHGAIQ